VENLGEYLESYELTLEKIGGLLLYILGIGTTIAGLGLLAISTIAGLSFIGGIITAISAFGSFLVLAFGISLIITGSLILPVQFLPFKKQDLISRIASASPVVGCIISSIQLSPISLGLFMFLAYIVYKFYTRGE